MLRQLQDQTPVLRITSPVPISKGGTGSRTVSDAVDALGGIPRSWLGAPNGILMLDENGLISEDSINLTAGARGHPIDGPRSVEYGKRARFRLTAQNAIDNITASTVPVLPVEIGDKVVYVTAPLSGESFVLTINGRSVTIRLTQPGVLTPEITAPGLDQGVESLFTFQSSRMVDSSIRYSNEAQLITGVLAVPVGATALDLSGREGIDGKVEISFNGKVHGVGKAMSHRTLYLNGATSVGVVVSGTAKCDYRWVMSDRVHHSSDWEVASDRNFTNIVYSGYEDTVNLTSLTLRLPNGEYYGRVRYNATDYQPNIDLPAVIRKPVVTKPGLDGEQFNLGNDLTSSSFAVEQGYASHVSSDWEIATDVNFVNVVGSVTGSVQDLVSWRTSYRAPSGTVLYARVRYTGESAV